MRRTKRSEFEYDRMTRANDDGWMHERDAKRRRTKRKKRKYENNAKAK